MAPQPPDGPAGLERPGVGGAGQRPQTGTPPTVTIVAHDIGAVRGGMERQLTDLLAGLLGLGHEVTVIGRTCELPPSERLVFHRVRGPGRPFLIAYPWFMLAGSLAVRRWRRGVVQATGAIVLNKVDVVAVHYCQQVGTATPSRASWPFRVNIKLSGVLKRIGERVCFRLSRAASFVCVSKGVADEVREHYPYLAERIATIYNGVDTAGFAPGVRAKEAQEMRERLEIEGERAVAAFVGSEWERKGLGAVIRALPSAPEWTVVVAGGGDEHGYRRLADSLGVGARLRWLGVSSDIQLVYQLSDAFVMASSYETFSLVTFEAAASGLAILATPVNGVRELIDDGRNGLLVSTDPTVIAARLRRIAGDPALRSRLGRAARESALEFGRERMVAAHSVLYAQLGRAGRV